MRIAHVITRMILGGAQENTLLCCRELMREHGDQVLLVTGPALGPEGSLIEEAQRLEIPMAVISSLRRAIHPWRDATAYLAIKRTLREFQPDVVHTHSAKAGMLGRIAARALGVRGIVHTVHGAPFHDYQGRAARAALRWCERYAAKRCDALITVADAMTNRLVEADVVPREKCTTIFSGMDVDAFRNAERLREETRSELGYEPQQVVVGKIARLFHLKGHEYVIEAARQVVRRHPSTRFLLVGDGILRKSIERQIDEAELGDHFQFVGLVPAERIPKLISAMDLVVHASLREGLARVLPQALIAGKPVVSFDIDGAREVVLPGGTGQLVPPQCTDLLADAICELAKDPALRTRLGREGQRRLTEPFRHQHMTRQIRGLYGRVLATTSNL